MTRYIFICCIFLTICVSWGQVPLQYPSLKKLNSNTQTVYYSSTAETRAISIAQEVQHAALYFTQHFQTKPTYTLLVLSPDDWKHYAHPKAIYGIPHYLPDNRLVVAAENNAFWKSNTPALEILPANLAAQFKQIYTDETGVLNLAPMFDLLAIHELGHAFQQAAGMQKQRHWLNELLCNLMLHTYLATNSPNALKALTVYPLAMVATVQANKLKYTDLADFETHYQVLAQQHPDNYGWFQCRLHIAAAEIYEQAGEQAMLNYWNLLLPIQAKLSDEQLLELFKNEPTFNAMVTRW